MVRGVAGTSEGHLVATPAPLRLVPVHLLRTGPALGRAEDDHRPAGTGDRAVASGGFLSSLTADLGDLVHHVIEHLREPPVVRDRILVIEAGREYVRRSEERRVGEEGGGGWGALGCERLRGMGT